VGDSQLNFVELLRRIGVKNRTGVDLAETVRMTVGAGDLSHLVPPIAVPVAGVTLATAAGGLGTFGQFTIQCLSPGGLFVLGLQSNDINQLGIFVSQANPFGALVAVPHQNFAFGQTALSVASAVAVAGAAVVPAGAPLIRGISFTTVPATPIFVGPGEFFCLEAETADTAIQFSIWWQEIPAAQRLP